MSQEFGTQTRGTVVTAPKSMAVSYILWILLGHFGVHKFYLHQNIQGVVYLVLTVLGYLTIGFFVGYVFLIPLWSMLILDLFWIPGRVRRLNTVS